MDKPELRRQFRGIPLPEPASQKTSERLFHWLAARLPGTISTYRAMEDEVDVSSLVDRLPGWRWVLPRIEGDESLTWRDARVELESHRWGMDQPRDIGPSIDRTQIDIFLVPGLAFDRSGNRLGRGRGFYDGELSTRRTDSLAVGVASNQRVVDEVPTELHDVPVTHLATEEGVNPITV